MLKLHVETSSHNDTHSFIYIIAGGLQSCSCTLKLYTVSWNKDIISSAFKVSERKPLMASLQCYYSKCYQWIFGTNCIQHGYTGLFCPKTLVLVCWPERKTHQDILSEWFIAGRCKVWIKEKKKEHHHIKMIRKCVYDGCHRMPANVLAVINVCRERCWTL